MLNRFKSIRDIILDDSSIDNDELNKIDLLSDISLSIIKYRLDNDLSQSALARKMEVSQPMISKLESGEYNPTILALYEIAQKIDFEFDLNFGEKINGNVFRFVSTLGENENDIKQNDFLLEVCA